MYKRTENVLMNGHGVVVEDDSALEVRVAHRVDEVEQVAVE
jgi:hypothetical protein